MFSNSTVYSHYSKFLSVEANKKLAYSRPEVYSLGTLKKVQAYYTGDYADGPSSPYWYDGSC